MREQDVIDLSLGHPSRDLLPLELLHAMSTQLASGDVSLLQYGVEAGEASFRAALAAFMTTTSGNAAQTVDPARLFVTAGASQGLDLFCSLYTAPGDVVLVEEPTYHLALAVFADHGLEVRSLPGGAQPEVLAAALRAARAKLVYLVPSFANPTGATLPAARREALVAATARAGAWLVADEVYRFLHFGGADTAPPSLAGPAHVVTLGSLAKVLAPGLRLGWLEAAPAVVERLVRSGLLRSGGGLNPLAAALTRDFVAGSGLLAHLKYLRERYAARAAALAQALTAALPTAHFSPPHGGYFLWLQVPGSDSAARLPRAQTCGVSYHPGVRFSAQGACRDFYRLSFAHYPPATLRDGAARLAQALA